jgi:Zn-dependent protease
LVEPPPSQGDLHFSLLGFPVRIHPFFWIASLFLGMNLPTNLLLMWVPAVLICILLHELSHAVVMRAYGIDAAIVLYSFGGLAIPRRSRWGGRRYGPWGQILISFAGPASGFILSAVLALALRAGGYQVHFLEDSWRDIVPWVQLDSRMGTAFVNMIFEITVLWGVLNLLPVLPLDGGQIAQQLFIIFYPHDAIRQSLILSILVAGSMSFVAFVQWKEIYLGVFFLYLAYSNFTSLQGARW